MTISKAKTYSFWLSANDPLKHLFDEVLAVWMENWMEKDRVIMPRGYVHSFLLKTDDPLKERFDEALALFLRDNKGASKSTFIRFLLTQGLFVTTTRKEEK